MPDDRHHSEKRRVPHELDTILREIPQLTGQPVVTPLLDGITNHNYRIESGDEIYVLRVAGENTAQLGIDRAYEHHCAQAAAAIGVGAEVIAWLPHHRALLTRFLPGRVLSVGDASCADVLQRVALALRKLHQSPAVPGEFSAFQTIEQYKSLAVAAGVKLPHDWSAVAEELAALRRATEGCKLACPCHNDLLPANLIDDGDAVRIIDWEYAGMGDPFFDLGNFAENHCLSTEQERDLLRLYVGQAGRQDWQRLRMMRRVSALREALWGFLQSGISRLEFDFVAYAQQHLARFRQAGSA